MVHAAGLEAVVAAAEAVVMEAVAAVKAGVAANINPHQLKNGKKVGVVTTRAMAEANVGLMLRMVMMVAASNVDAKMMTTATLA